MLLGKKLRGDGCGGIVLTFDDDLKSVAEEKTGQTTEARRSSGGWKMRSAGRVGPTTCRIDWLWEGHSGDSSCRPKVLVTFT